MGDTKMLHDLEVEADLVDAVTVDDLDVDREFSRAPSDYAYWGHRHADAVGDHLTAKLAVKVEWARACDRARLRLSGAEHAKAPTEAAVERAAVQDAEYLRICRDEIERERERVRQHHVVQAIGVKRDALTSIAAKLRREMEGGEVVRGRQADGL